MAQKEAEQPNLEEEFAEISAFWDEAAQWQREKVELSIKLQDCQQKLRKMEISYKTELMKLLMEMLEKELSWKSREDVLEKELQVLRKRSNKDKENQELKKKLSSYKAREESLKTESQDVRSMLKLVKAREDKLKAEHEVLKEQLATQKPREDRLKIENQDLRGKLAAQKCQQDKLKTQNLGRKLPKSAQEDKLKTENQNLREKLSMQKSREEKLKICNQDLETKLKDAITDKTALERETQSLKDKVEKEWMRIDLALENLKGELVSQKCLEEELRAENQDLRSKLKTIIEHIESESENQISDVENVRPNFQLLNNKNSKEKKTKRLL